MKRKITLILLLLIIAAASLIGLTACSQDFSASYDYLVTFNYNTESLDLEGDFGNQYLGVNEGSRIMQPCKPSSEQYSNSDFKEKQISRYEVQGWYLAQYDVEGNVLKDEDGFAVQDRLWNFNSDVVTQNVTLYAKLALKPYVRLMVDGEVSRERNFVVGSTVRETAVSPTKPKKTGWTFCGYYSDAEFENKLTFPFTMGEEDINIYAKFIEGTWSIVSTAEEFDKAFTQSARIYLDDDIDFTGKTWKSGFEFEGVINGNGYTISNITCTLSSSVSGIQTNFGLFGVLKASSQIYDVEFENVTVTVNTVSNVPIQAALFAYRIEDGAKLENVTVSGSISRGTVYSGNDEDISLYAVCCNGNLESENVTGCNFNGIIVE